MQKSCSLDSVIYQYSIYSVVQKSGTLDAVIIISIFNIQCGAKKWTLDAVKYQYSIYSVVQKSGTLDAVIYQYLIYSVVQNSGTLDAVIYQYSKYSVVQKSGTLLYPSSYTRGSHFFCTTLYIFITRVFVFIRQINFLAFRVFTTMSLIIGVTLIS